MASNMAFRQFLFLFYAFLNGYLLPRANSFRMLFSAKFINHIYLEEHRGLNVYIISVFHSTKIGQLTRVFFRFSLCDIIDNLLILTCGCFLKCTYVVWLPFIGDQNDAMGVILNRRGRFPAS